MPNATVVFLGGLPVHIPAVQELASEFGWTVQAAEDLTHLRQLGSMRNVAAILFDPRSLGLTATQALVATREIVPHARLIPCHRFSDVVNWPEWADAGAFHALALPLKLSEVRQSLGFVWSARLRRSAHVLAIRKPEPRSEVSQETPDLTAQLRDAS